MTKDDVCVARGAPLTRKEYIGLREYGHKFELLSVCPPRISETQGKAPVNTLG